MKRVTNALLGIIFLLALAPAVFSQDGSPQPCPLIAPGTLGCELVEWSQLQDPVPLPEPDAKPVPPSRRQHDPQPGQAANRPAQPQSPRQNITGVILRQGSKCVLKAGDNTTYQLDDQDKATQYQGKQVRIVGRFDLDTNTLHIESIALAS